MKRHVAATYGQVAGAVCDNFRYSELQRSVQDLPRVLQSEPEDSVYVCGV